MKRKRARNVDDGEKHGYFGWEGQRKRCHRGTKRARNVDDGENIPCIVLLKNQHGYFGWEGQRKRCHRAASSGVISGLKSSTELLKGVISSSGGVSGTKLTGNECLEALVSNKHGNCMHDDGGNGHPKGERMPPQITKQKSNNLQANRGKLGEGSTLGAGSLKEVKIKKKRNKYRPKVMKEVH